MKITEKFVANALALRDGVNEKFFHQFGFYIKDASFQKIEDYMHQPKDSSSLAVTRILFGLAMLFDIPYERGGAQMEKRWGDPNVCHFPLFPFLYAMPMPYMAAVYAGLWFGAIGIMLGYKFRFSSIMFTVCYWYLFLVEKSFWNNHSYLFGLVALLMSCTDAGSYWSIDTNQDPTKSRATVPYWNYFILKYQFFILYFMAGMKKGTAEWLSGYSMQNLSEHWVFWPFRLFLTVPQIDFFIVHWFIFMFDLTIAMWMMWSRTRHVAMVFCALFHLMNSRLFRIGMFPWVCLATMPLFYPFDWPKLLLRKIQSQMMKIKTYICLSYNNFFVEISCECSPTSEEKETQHENIQEKQIPSENIKTHDKTDDVTDEDEDFNNDRKSKHTKIDDDYKNDLNADKNNRPARSNSGKLLTMYFIVFHVITQAFLPYSHFITKGYNNWTDGLYGYSWDMMVHSWDTHAVIVKVVDNEKQFDFYIDPFLYSPTERWIRQGDMVHQYARCLREKIIDNANNMGLSDKISQNLSIYVDVWSSLNGRVTQRQFDSKVDMLKSEWSPFKRTSYLMPLLDEKLEWRKKLDEIKEYVLKWNNKSDVVFLADFPGYEQEKFISMDLRNVSLTILEGEVVYQPQVTTQQNGYSYKLSTGANVPLDTNTFHKVYNIGQKPAYYMYTFYNSTDVMQDSNATPKFPIVDEFLFRYKEYRIFLEVMFKNLGNIVLCLSKCK